MADFTVQLQAGVPAGTRLFRLQQANQTVSFGAVIDLWHTQPQFAAFAPQFTAQPDVGPVIAFANLGSDATLVVPRPLADASHYRHLAAPYRQQPAQP